MGWGWQVAVITVEQVVQLLETRQRATSVTVERLRRLRDAYNGDILIPLPEMDHNEQASVANLISIGLDQSAMRISSTMPDVYYPTVQPGDPASEKRARIRKRATLGWWEANKMPLKLRQRARYMIGYASSPVMLRPDGKRGIARWELRNPLTCYPAATTGVDDLVPADTIFVYQRPLNWVAANYPDRLPQLRNVEPDSTVSVVEYVDADTILTGVTAVTAPNVGQAYNDTEMLSKQVTVELERIPNRTGNPLVVIAGRFTLDRPHGQFDSLVGMYQTQARLFALEMIAVERGIFPDTYLVSRPGEQAKFVTGPHDGRSGLVNIISGGTLQEAGMNSNLTANNLIDRIERSMRITSGTPAEYGGESVTNVRTGKRGDAILSAVVDFPIQEAQEVLAASLTEENKIAISICRTYFGNDRRSFYISTGKTKGHVDYTPNKDFESDNNIVTYSYAGADANSLTVGLGQRITLGTMSKRTAQEIDPLVSDPEQERDRVIGESLERALLQSLQLGAQQGQIPPTDLARIMTLVVTDKKDLADAVAAAQKEAQERQATPAPQGSPETQPGISQPGSGAQQPAQPVTPPSLDMLLQQLGG